LVLLYTSSSHIHSCQSLVDGGPTPIDAFSHNWKVKMSVYFVKYVVFYGLESPGTLASQTEFCRDTGRELFKTKKLELPGKPGTNEIPSFGPTRVSSIAAIHSQHPYRPHITTVEERLALHIQIIFFN